MSFSNFGNHFRPYYRQRGGEVDDVPMFEGEPMFEGMGEPMFEGEGEPMFEDGYGVGDGTQMMTPAGNDLTGVDSAIMMMAGPEISPEPSDSIEDLLEDGQCLFSDQYQVSQSCNANNYCIGDSPYIEQSIESPELLAGSIDNCVVPERRNDCPKCSWDFYSDKIDDGLNLPHLNMDQFALSENSYDLLTEIKHSLKPKIGENEEAGKINMGVIDRHITSNGGIAPYVAEILNSVSASKLSDAVTAISSILLEGGTLSGEELKKRLIAAYKADTLQANSEEIFMPKGVGIIANFCESISNAGTITISFSFCCCLILMFFAGMGILGYLRGKKQRAVKPSYSNSVAKGTGGLAQTTASAAGV